MAGTSSAFNPTEFRSQIRSTMLMGLPSATIDRPTFQWTTTNTYGVEDASGHPYDWTSTPVTTDAHADVQVECAVEFLRVTQSEGTGVGTFDMSRAVLTLLDTEQAKVAGADTVLLGQNVYDVDFIEPPVGLFSVTVYRWHCRARSES